MPDVYKRLSCVCALLIFSCGLYAKPSGLHVSAGNGKIVLDGAQQLQIECGPRSILAWDQFAIAQGETVQFLLPNAQSAVLNRVIGGSQTQLLGSLLSNGQIFLINPNGVLIGKDAIIQTGGFLLSTLDVLDEDFLKGGELSFTGKSQSSIVNLGTIDCPTGDIALFGQTVINEGTLLSPNGSVFLAAGSDILLKPEGIERVFIRTGVAETPLIHTGDISALSIELKSSIQTPHARAIQSAGSLTSLSKAEEGGRIILYSTYGKTEVSGAVVAKQGDRGGEIHLLGEEIFLKSGAMIDASGNLGGGEILVGGSFQGKNTSIPSAELSFIDEGVILRADALSEGDGGQIVVWSEGATGFFGEASARGGASGGNGGLIEVSGPALTFQGTANTTAPRGETGTLLLDPNNITIVTGATSPNVFVSNYYDGETTAAATLDTATLSANLGISNVTVQTSDITAGGSGIITLAAAETITWATTNMLTIRASRNFVMNAASVISSTSASRDFDAVLLINNANAGAGTLFEGIFLNDAQILSVGGNIILDGTGGRGLGTSNQYGVHLMSGVNNLGSVHSTTGAIAITGHSSLFTNSNGSNNYGIFIENAATGGNIATSGNINLNGFCMLNPAGANAALNNAGVRMTNSALVAAAGAGCISIQGTIPIPAGLSMNNGIQIDTNSVVSAVDGSLRMFGQGGCRNGAAQSYGILIVDSSSVRSTGALDNGNRLTLEGEIIPFSAVSGPSARAVGVMIVNSINGVTSVDKDIVIVGSSIRDLGQSFQQGILIGSSVGIFAPFTSGPSSVTATGTAGITLNGYGSTNTVVSSQSCGVSITNQGGVAGVYSTVSTNSGNIAIYGETIGFSCAAVQLKTFGRASTATGNISITGVSKATVNNALNAGILVEDSIVEATSGAVSGTILLSGIGSNTTGGNGVRCLRTNGDASLDAGFFRSVNQDIRIVGSGGQLGSNCNGIFCQSTLGPLLISSTGSGSILLDGKNSGISSTSNGVYFIGDGNIPQSGISAVSGPVALMGLSGVGSGPNVGIYFSNRSRILSDTGDISLSGFGNGASGSNHGIYFSDSSIESTGNQSGTIVLSGAGSSQGDNTNIGIFFESANAIISSVEKDIFLTGIGNGTLTGNDGIRFASGARITPTLAANVTLQGTGSVNGTQQNHGINIDTGSGILLENGVGNLVGYGGGTLDTNRGISIGGGSSLRTAAAGTGSYFLNGTGGKGTDNNVGIYLESRDLVATIQTEGNHIHLYGSGSGTGDGNIGIELFQDAAVTATAAGTGTIRFDGAGSSLGAGVNNRGIYLHGAGQNLVQGVTQDLILIAESGGGATESLALDPGEISLTTSGTLSITTIERALGGDISILNGGIVDNPNGDIFIRSARNLVLQGGNGVQSRISAGGILNLAARGSATLQGGVNPSESALILSSGGGALNINADGNLNCLAGSGDMSSASIETVNGSLAFTVGGDVTLTSGLGAGSYTQIGGQSGSVGNIVFSHIGGNVILTGDSYAVIGFGNPTNYAAAATGNIELLQVGGSITLNGDTVGPGVEGFAQIGHIDPAAGNPIIAGNILIQAAGSVTLTGGTTGADTYARIGHGGRAGVATFNAGEITVFAGISIGLTSQTGLAQIANPSTFAGSGGITLVTDNAFPLDAASGPGGFSMNATAVVSNNQAITGGQVRIYTATPAQNGLVLGQIINGAPFPAGPVLNAPYEMFSFYYGAGQYAGPEFVVYYKFPIPACPCCFCPLCPACPSSGSCSPSTGAAAEPFFFPIYFTQIANSELSDRLPIINGFYSNYHKGFYDMYYHSRVCKSNSSEEGPGQSCSPGYSRFYPFIFESDVY